MWRIAILSTLFLSLIHSQEVLKSSEIRGKLDEAHLSVGVFMNRQSQEALYREYQIEEALQLLDRDLQKLYVFESDISGDDVLKQEFSVTQENGPEIRFFWKGIMMNPPLESNFKGVKIYRWIKKLLREINTPRISVVDAETFFETKVESHPYCVVCLGKRTSSECSFIEEYSYIPDDSIKFYVIEEKLGKKVFQSIGLSGAKTNTLIINNVAKKIEEFEEDYDFRPFHLFTKGVLHLPGTSSDSDFISHSLALGKLTIAVLPAQWSSEYISKDFIKSLREVTKNVKADIYYIRNKKTFIDKVEYTDCQEMQSCIFIYQNAHLPHRKKRYRIIDGLDDLSVPSLERILTNFFNSRSKEPYFYSDDSKLESVGNSSLIKVLSRNNQEAILTGKDSLILAYEVCGSNCLEKLKIMNELASLIAPSSQANLNLLTCDIKKNEMPESYYAHTQLNFFFIPGSDSSKLIPLNTANSSTELLSLIQKYSSSDIVSLESAEEEFEDYI